jgi:tRNA (guanine-N7-)-methyltransferase
MSRIIPTPRSAFAAQLRAFPDFVFPDSAALQHRGRWAAYFRDRIGPGFDGRIVLEIGCWDVTFLSRIAAKFPTSGFIGLDWKCRPLYTGALRLKENGALNVALLRGRGQDCAEMFAPAEVDEIWVFHPDPCAGEDERQHRLIAEPFLKDAHAILRDECSALCLKTDHAGYYQSVLGLFGLPEPPWFADNAHGSPAPRVRRGDLMRQEDVPSPNPMVQQLFEVAATSGDFWNDPAVLARTARHAFTGETTAFEQRFVSKRWPIYYFEMHKRIDAVAI